MAVLTREQFVSNIRGFVGETPDDNGLQMLQDMTETFDSMAGDTHVDWKDKYEQNDKQWRQKYADAFNAPVQPKSEEPTPEEKASSIKISDLFIKKER